jgi:hypothetical protein
LDFEDAEAEDDGGHGAKDLAGEDEAREGDRDAHRSIHSKPEPFVHVRRVHRGSFDGFASALEES